VQMPTAPAARPDVSSPDGPAVAVSSGSAAPISTRPAGRSAVERVAAGLLRALPPVLIILAIIGAWEAASRWFGLPEYLLPAPSRIGGALVTGFPLFTRHAPITIGEALLGFLIGNTAAVLLAIAFVHSSTVERAIYPMAVAMRSIPFVALAPVLVIWMGHGLAPKVTIAALVSFFPTLVNMVRGLRSIDREAFELMHTLSATHWQVMWELRWPSAMPFLFSALKISAAGTVLGAVVAEWIGADRGLGYLVVTSTYEFRIPQLWATIAVTSALALSLFGLVILAERLTAHPGNTVTSD
jgi:NitT/TauT family transport system permease protein